MASKKTKVVDGYTAIRAAQQAARDGRGDPVRPGTEEERAAASKAAEKTGARIGRSVVPSKREVLCPQCGYVSEVTGRLQLFVCQGCRHRMKLDDITLPAEGEWSEELETGGSVTIPAGLRCTGGKIVANDVILEGKMDGVEIRACRRLLLKEGGEVDWVRLECRDMEIAAGLQVTPGRPWEGRHLILEGKYSGRVDLKGSLQIRPGGEFSGEVKAAGLQVDEGGGLNASLDINPDYAPPPPERRPPRAKKTPEQARKDRNAS